MSWNSVWLSLHTCCHKSFSCDWGGKQRLNLFKKHLCFELTGLTCCFSLARKKEGFTIRSSGIASTVVEQWSELSAVVWMLSFCSFHRQLVHVYNFSWMSLQPSLDHVENITLGMICGMWKTSCSSAGDLHEEVCATVQINCSCAVTSAPISNITLVMLPTASSYAHASAWSWRRWTEFWGVVRLVHIYASKATCNIQEPPRPGKWLAEDVGGSGGQTDWFSACFMKYYSPFSLFFAFFSSNPLLFSSLW